MATLRKTSRRRREYYIVPHINHHALHVHLWRGVDHRGRRRVHLGELSTWLGVSYDMANNHLMQMRDEGRMRKVHEGPIAIYQIANPATYDPHDPSTHAVKHSVPQWG